MTRFNGGYIMLDLNSNNIYNEAKDVIGTSKPIMLYPLNNETPYYIKKLALVNKEGVLYVNINDEYLIEPDNVVTPIEPESLPIATASVLGGVKIGSGINVTEDGTISVTGGTQHLYKHQITFSGQNLNDDNISIVFTFYSSYENECNTEALLKTHAKGIYNAINTGDNEIYYGDKENLFYLEINQNNIDIALSQDMSIYDSKVHISDIFNNGSFTISDGKSQIL